MRTYLGVDVGTSMTKAVLFDETGASIAVAERASKLTYPGTGRVEQNVEDVLHSLAAAVSDLAGGAAGEPELIGITGQGDGCWLTDATGRGTRPAVSWMDGRGGTILSKWEAEGTVEAVFRINGNTLFPGAQATILRWLAEHEPDSLDAAQTAAYCKDVMLHRLTGLRATDPSDASLPFGDPGAEDYSARALALCGLSEHARLLPPVRYPLPSATLSPEGAALTGLAPGVPVSSGPFDLPACAAGSGVAEPGDGLLIIGTTLACQVLTDELDTAGEPAGMHLATARAGHWLRAHPAMVGTACLDWVLELLGISHDQVSPLLEQTVPGAGGVEMLPYLAPSGERAPFVDPLARGQLTGLSLTTNRADIVRGTCEGIAFAARDCFTDTGLDGNLVVCGGGARSRPWLQIFADVLGRELRISHAPGVGARGAVLGAIAASGEEVDTPRWTASDSVVHPIERNVKHYDEAFAHYRAQRDAARPLWRQR
jgi:sugar (pentulose or hexulose) kinase